MKYQIVCLEIEEKDGEMPTIDIPDEVLENALALEIISRGGKPCLRYILPQRTTGNEVNRGINITSRG